MKTRTLAEYLRSGTSALTLSAVAFMGASALQPAFAANTETNGLFGGGSTLASLTVRQLFDCYMGATIGSGAAGLPGGVDGYSFTSAFNSAAPTPGDLPNTCTSISVAVEGLYAGVGSGGGLRGFLSNSPYELFGGSPSTVTSTAVGLPALPPSYLDGNNSNAAFTNYPYPRIDFAASDSPLASVITSLSTTTFSVTPTAPTTSWAGTSTTTTIIALSTTATVAYSTGSWGQPIQLPLFEAVVDISVNLPASGSTVSGTTWTINSQSATPSQAGGVIQLSTAQICAIFSGLVTNWNSAASIPALDDNGNALTTELFDSANTNASTAAAPYIPATSSAPINVVYRSDGSGTSFIFTNYLATVCPLIDPTNANHYVSIFASNPTSTSAPGFPVVTTGDPDYTTASTFAAHLALPNTSFKNLISRIQAIQGSSAVTNWIGESGSANVAANIGNATNSPSQIGNIGYLSNDFNQPYNAATTAPESASIQNEYDRIHAVYHPGATSFVAPTPANANTAWAGLALPTTGTTYAGWNPYAQTTTANPQGGLNLTGLPTLPLYNGQTAYPLTGTTFLFLYSCYGNGLDGTTAATRVTNLTNELAWLYATSGRYTLSGSNPASRNNPLKSVDVADIIENNGFHELPALWSANIITEYVLDGPTNNGTTSAIEPISAGTNGCSGVTGGAQ